MSASNKYISLARVQDIPHMVSAVKLREERLAIRFAHDLTELPPDAAVIAEEVNF